VELLETNNYGYPSSVNYCGDVFHTVEAERVKQSNRKKCRRLNGGCAYGGFENKRIIGESKSNGTVDNKGVTQL
jgi:hypothetical protein